jgi:nucleobase:cation symporter-1, NCS1 family
MIDNLYSCSSSRRHLLWLVSQVSTSNAYVIVTLYHLIRLYLIGIAVTSAGEILYGKVLWDPLTLINHWDNRAAAFFASFSFLLCTIGTNISANSLSAANDLMAMFPKYIDIRRGQVICAILGGWVLCPWEILASAPGFLSFMSGYTVFLGPFAGVYVAFLFLKSFP